MQKKEAGEQLLQKINSKTRGSFEAVLIENNICPICIYENHFSELVMRKGEKVCLTCGFVSDASPSFIQRDGPRISLQGKRVNEFASNDGKGGTLGKKGLFFMIAHQTNMDYTCPHCGYVSNDAPIRARQIATLTENVEAPKITTLKRLGRKRINEWGFGDDHTQRSNIIFSNFFGRVLKRIGTLSAMTNEHVSQQLADACFAYALKMVKGERAYKDAIEKLEIPTSSVEGVELFFTLVETLRQRINSNQSDADTLCIDTQEKDN